MDAKTEKFMAEFHQRWLDKVKPLLDMTSVQKAEHAKQFAKAICEGLKNMGKGHMMEAYLVSEEVLQQVLDALEDAAQATEYCALHPSMARYMAATDVLRAILSKSPSEPVGLVRFDEYGSPAFTVRKGSMPVYRKDA